MDGSCELQQIVMEVSQWSGTSIFLSLDEMVVTLLYPALRFRVFWMQIVCLVFDQYHTAGPFVFFCYLIFDNFTGQMNKIIIICTRHAPRSMNHEWWPGGVHSNENGTRGIFARILLPLFQIIGHFSKSRYIAFAMHLDKHYI